MRRVQLALQAMGVLLMAACGADKLVVGVVLPETGINQGYGASLKAGVKLAFDDAIAKQSPKGIEAHYRDSLSTPEYARKEAEDLFKGGALIVIGGATSAEAKWMIPEAEHEKHVLISPSASEAGLAASSNLFFRVVPSDDVEATVAADFLVKQRKAHNVLVLYQKGTYGEGVLPIFSGEVAKAGGKIADQLPVGPSDWDKAVTDALAQQKPDAVFVCAYAEEIVASLSVLHDAKYAGTVCVTSAIDAGNAAKRASALMDGIFVPMVRLDFTSQQEPMRSFVQRFKAANRGNSPDLFAAYGYDAALVAIYALQGPPLKSNDQLLRQVMSLGGRQGVTGPLAFDAVGNIAHRPRIHCLKGGAFEDCDPTPLT
jgi:branched-chain amino acid transport system substrate-binding protein